MLTAHLNTKIKVLCLALSLVLTANAKSEEFDADLINKAGSMAAGFAEVSNGKATDAMVEEKFSALGDNILNIAKKWAKDPELEEAPPAFRRFLFFDYMTKGTNIIAGASNPESLLINGDASVEVLFDDPEVIAAANKAMSENITEPRHEDLGQYALSIYPMIPAEEKAQKCIACHASEAVGRPYPESQKVLGYTFVAVPK